MALDKQSSRMCDLAYLTWQWRNLVIIEPTGESLCC